MDGYLGQIIMFGGNFAPRGWAFCDGQLLSISAYQDLYSLLGITYGGDNRNTFGLPDLRGRVPVHAGRGPGLTSRTNGNRAGEEAVTLDKSQIPSHDHGVSVAVSNIAGEESDPTGNVIAMHAGAFNEDQNQMLGGVHNETVGGGLSHNNMQPYSVVNFVICTTGLFPKRS